MGNVNAGPAGAPRRDRRREMTFLFYFVFGFVLIRVWILLIESGSVVVESVGGVVTFLLLFSLYLRYRMLRQQQEDFELNRHNQQDINNPDLALLQALFRTPRRGVSQEIINSLYCFSYYPVSPDEHMQISTQESNTVTSTTPVADSNTATHSDEAMDNVVGDIESGAQNNNEDTICCSICLAEYVQSEHLIMLPCRHVYHKSCVTEWLLGHTQCPLCKQDVLELLDQQLYVQTQIERLRVASSGREENAALADMLQAMHGPHYVYGAGTEGSYQPDLQSDMQSNLHAEGSSEQRLPERSTEQVGDVESAGGAVDTADSPPVPPI